MKKCLALLLWIALLMGSCIPPNAVEIEDTVDSEWAIPLFHISTSLDSLFEKYGTTPYVDIYPDGLIAFIYQGDILKVHSEEIFKPIGVLTIPITPGRDTLPLPIDDQIITRGHIKGDTMIAQLVAHATDTVHYRIRIPSMYDADGNVFVMEGTCLPQQDVVVKKSMAGYTFEFLNGNSFEIEMTATTPDNNPTIGLVYLSFTDLRFSYLEGYFAKNTFELPLDTIDILVFQQQKEGKIYFDDPRIRVTAFNSFGFPAAAEIQQLFVIDKDGNKIPLQSPLISQGVEVNYPSLDEIGQVKETHFNFSKANSNIDVIFNANPIQLVYDFLGVGNPDTSDRSIGFATDSSFMRIQVTVELPLDGWVDRFVMTSTSDLDSFRFDIPTDSALLKLFVNNGLPTALDLQVYFYQNNTIIDSLPTSNPITVESAQVDDQGRVIAPRKSEILIPISRSWTDMLPTADKARAVLRISTDRAPTTTVRVTKDQFVEVSAGIKLIVQ